MKLSKLSTRKVLLANLLTSVLQLYFKRPSATVENRFKDRNNSSRHFLVASNLK